MNRYDSYKESGVAWIGEIPTDWTTKRLKTLVENVSDKVSDGNGNSPYIGLENIQSWTGKYVQSNQPISPDGTANLFQPSDFLFGKLRPYLAKAFIPDSSGKCSTELLVLRPLKAERKFLFYFSLSDRFIQIVNSSTYGAKMPRASWNFIGNLPACLPDAKQQRLIARYLDKETARIDQLIANKRQQVKKLDELRQITISHAVTQGLDPTVPMKDSGIDWLGKIPDHWEIHRIKDIARINGEALDEDTEPDYLLQYIDIGNVSSNGKIAEIQELSFKDAPSRARRKAKDGDTILSTVRTYLKAISHIQGAPDNLIVSTGYAVFSPHSRIFPKFLYYLVNAEWFVDTVVARSTGVAYPAINPPQLAAISTWLPPLKEQESIARYLDKVTARIDQLIANKRQQIKKLEELRKITINDAVTGKVKVTDRCPG